MPEEIEKIQHKIVPTLKQAGVLKSSVFGSVVRGDADSNSDIDILVELPKDSDLFDLIALQQKLESLLKKKVDIGTYRSIKPILRDRIMSEQIQIYAR